MAAKTETVRTFLARRLPLVVMTILLFLNTVPCMVSSGKHRWFVLPVPEPERFASVMADAPTATRVYGYPFACYSQMGREFRRKGGDLLFWPSAEQPPLASRLSFGAIAGNIALLVGVSLLLLLDRKHDLRKDRQVSPAVVP